MDEHGHEIENSAQQDDGGAGRDIGVIGEQEPRETGRKHGEHRRHDQPRHVLRPEACRDGRKQHDADREQGTQRLKTGHQVEHHQHEKEEMRG